MKPEQMADQLARALLSEEDMRSKAEKVSKYNAKYHGDNNV